MIASWISRVRFEVMTTIGGARRDDRPQLRNGDLKIGEDLEQIRLERLVGTVELVDQQHRRHAVLRRERLEDRALEQKARREDVVRQPFAVLLPGRFREPDLDHLARVVPFVDGRRDVEPFVALQPHQPLAEGRREHLGDLGLAHTRLALQEQRASHPECEEHARREPAVGEIVVPVEQRHDGVDIGRQRGWGHE